MSARFAQRRRRKRIVLVFGEDENDTKTIASFIRALCPDGDFVILPQRRPPVLIKGAKSADIPSRVQSVAAAIDAASVDNEVIAVFAHQDCDEVEPADSRLTDAIEGAFAGAGYPVYAATPAWETETWLMQWPEAFRRHVSVWRSIEQFSGRNLGVIENAKEVLSAALHQNRNRRDYRESDSPAIAEVVRAAGWIRHPKGRSKSFERFRDRVDAMCIAQGIA